MRVQPCSRQKLRVGRQDWILDRSVTSPFDTAESRSARIITIAPSPISDSASTLGTVDNISATSSLLLPTFPVTIRSISSNPDAGTESTFISLLVVRFQIKRLVQQSSYSVSLLFNLAQLLVALVTPLKVHRHHTTSGQGE